MIRFMNAELTLTIEQSLIITPTVKMLKGSFYTPANFDYKKELTNRLTGKYMKQ